MNIEQMTALAAEYNNGKNGRALDVRDRYIAALLAQWNALIAGQEPVEWQFRWMNPGDNPNASEDEMSWKPVDLKHWNQSIDGRVAELRAHQYSGKPCYEVRALYTHPAPTIPAAQERPLSDVECWELGKPDSIDRAMTQDRAEPVAPAVGEAVLLKDGEPMALMQSIDAAIMAAERSGSARLNAVLVAARAALATKPQAEQEAAAKVDKVDAERWRWIRDGNSDVQGVIREPGKFSELLADDELDKIADQRRAARASNSGGEA